MTTVNDIAALIREVDGDNRMTPYDLGGTLAGDQHLSPYGILCRDLGAFVTRTNPDKRLSAGQLAELIVAEFNLTEGN